MRRLFLDTNVVPDFLAKREGFYEYAAKIISLPDNGEDILLLCSSLTFANANYILTHLVGKDLSRRLLSDFFNRCTITNVTNADVASALSSQFKDFEDALQYYSALHSYSDVIITRNKKDFSFSEIPVLEPKELFET